MLGAWPPSSRLYSRLPAQALQPEQGPQVVGLSKFALIPWVVIPGTSFNHRKAVLGLPRAPPETDISVHLTSHDPFPCCGRRMGAD